MRRFLRPALGLAAAAAVLLSACATAPSTGPMRFFITSEGSGKGADLGGIAGADALCQKLAAAAGAGGKTWRAYLSTQATPDAPAVNARDRIGRGPWVNAKGVVIASSVAELHGKNNLNLQTALTDKGTPLNGRTDKPNMHDILTGSQADGTAFPAGDDRTCGNWTRSAAGSAMVGHHDRVGLRDDEASRSWNASHPSKACSIEALRSTGGDGRLYCFAAN
jgi:hypothetical protein